MADDITRDIIANPIPSSIRMNATRPTHGPHYREECLDNSLNLSQEEFEKKYEKIEETT